MFERFKKLSYEASNEHVQIEELKYDIHFCSASGNTLLRTPTIVTISGKTERIFSKSEVHNKGNDLFEKYMESFRKNAFKIFKKMQKKKYLEGKGVALKTEAIDFVIVRYKGVETSPLTYTEWKVWKKETDQED